MYDRCVAGDRLRTVMSSIMRRRRGLKSAISILLSEGVGSNTHILSARRRSTPPCPLRRGSGFVQSHTANTVMNFAGGRGFVRVSPQPVMGVVGKVHAAHFGIS